MCCQHHRNKDVFAFSKVLTDVMPLWRRIAHARALDATLTLAFTIIWTGLGTTTTTTPIAPLPVPTTLPERATVAV